MTPPLARLMNVVWLHEQNHFDDEQLCDVLRDGLSKDVLEQWSAHKTSKGRTLVRMKGLEAYTKSHRSTIYRWQREKGFPKPVLKTPTSALYDLRDVDLWLQSDF